MMLDNKSAAIYNMSVLKRQISAIARQIGAMLCERVFCKSDKNTTFDLA